MRANLLGSSRNVGRFGVRRCAGGRRDDAIIQQDGDGKLLDVPDRAFEVFRDLGVVVAHRHIRRRRATLGAWRDLVSLFRARCLLVRINELR